MAFPPDPFKNDGDVINGMATSMKTLATYLVLVFFAAQFVAYFKWSNLGIIMAVKGAGPADVGQHWTDSPDDPVYSPVCHASIC